MPSNQACRTSSALRWIPSVIHVGGGDSLVECEFQESQIYKNPGLFDRDVHQQIVEGTVLDYGGLRKWQTDIFVYNAL